ncbi:MAG: nucleotide sugar dehydrogenase [Candidatus Omnitrophota bacterium]|nr:nucleotide sugar dehydrogenase [Candidatus Omnitrophota bacterium]
MDDFLREFKKRVSGKKIKIAIVGLGYVGFPLAMEFCRRGFSVLGIDIDKDRISRIKRKESYITDVSSGELRQALAKRKFSATPNFSTLKKIDAVIICVPTPLWRKYSPNISYIKQAVNSIAKNLKAKSLVILESTTYPGTTEEVILPLLERRNFRHNRDFYLCFSPERIDPGNKKFPLRKIPKVIGGITPEASQLAQALYGEIVERVVPVSSARAAEAVKLLENTFRLINIALIDELAMMAHKMKIDIWEVIKAASTKPFGFMGFFPGPGVGGHCIPKDPLYLYWKARHFGFRSRFIKLASDVIAYMPLYVAERVAEILRQKGRAIKKAKILVVGVSYKKDVKDLRKSPGLDLIEGLQRKGALVDYFDPLVPYLKIDRIDLKSVTLNEKRLKGFDCTVIAADHSCLDYDFLLRYSRAVFDTRNAYAHCRDKKIHRL